MLAVVPRCRSTFPPPPGFSWRTQKRDAQSRRDSYAALVTTFDMSFAPSLTLRLLGSPLPEARSPTGLSGGSTRSGRPSPPATT
jgi:hypothetical protein